MVDELEKYRKGGFVDVPRIVKDSLESELFPGMLPEIESIRETDFPLFTKLGRVYLDNGATTQEPQTVKDRMYEYRKSHMRGSNHSKNSSEAKEAQEMWEESKDKLSKFFNAENYYIAYTGGTTDASNWIATRFPLEKQDTVLITEMEHHSQILTARNMAKKVGADIGYVPVYKNDGRLDLDKLERRVDELSGKKGKVLLNLVHASNVSGVVNPVKKIREIVGDDCYIYLDLAQSAGHMPVDLDYLGADFAGVSAHKMYGPMGIGAFFIKKDCEPMLKNDVSGGGAVDLVSKHFTAYTKPPARFEPGTQDLEGAAEWGFTLDYLNRMGMDKIASHDHAIGKYFLGELQKIDRVRVYGPADFSRGDRSALFAFNIGNFLLKNYGEVAQKLDKRGVSVRDGCFCAHPYVAKLIGLPSIAHEARTGLMKLGVSGEMIKLPGAVRAAFAYYNNLEDAYKAVRAIDEISKEF
jgi:cysteine desulfurase / selenocysteine lyase